MPEMDEKKIERCFQKISQFQSSPAVAARDLDRARERLTKHMSRQRTKKPGIWRLFMRSGISKAAAAAVLIIAAAIVIHQSGGSVGLTTIALADISEAMKKVPWMRMTNGGLNGFGGNVAPPTELLLGFHTKIAASKDGKGNITLSDYSEHKSYTYDLEDGTLTIDYLYEGDFPAYLSSAFVVVEPVRVVVRPEIHPVLVVLRLVHHGPGEVVDSLEGIVGPVGCIVGSSNIRAEGAARRTGCEERAGSVGEGR